MENDSENYQAWLKENYELQQGVGYYHKITGDVPSEKQLIEAYSKYVIENKKQETVIEEKNETVVETKQENQQTAETKVEIEHISESEAIQILESHKGKGIVTDQNFDSKKKQKTRLAVLYKNGKLFRTFTYTTKHNPKPHAK